MGVSLVRATTLRKPGVWRSQQVKIDPQQPKNRDDDNTSVPLAISSVFLWQGKVISPTEDAHPPPKTPHITPSTFSCARGGGGGDRRAAIRGRARPAKKNIHDTSGAANTKPYQLLPVVGAARTLTGTSETSSLTCPSFAVASLHLDKADNLSTSI